MLIKSPRPVNERALIIPDAPTDPEKNAEFRLEMLDIGGNDPDWAAAINYRNEHDPVFYINTFGWTQNPKDFPQDPDQPIILFPNQAAYIRKLDYNVEHGRPLLLEKSREQLASVGTAHYCLWRWRYKLNASIKVGSMKEELVDGDDYATQIFPKIDYTLARQDPWLWPEGYNPKKGVTTRKDMIFINPKTGRTITGEATNKHFSVGGRFAMVWLDEFAKVQEQDSIHRKVANTTNCFVYTTTPEGYEKFADMVRSGYYDVFRLHWTGNHLWHPRGFRPEQCDWEKGVWPKDWICGPGCKVHALGGHPHSERFDRECEKYGWNQKDIAQELEIDYHKSGSSVFDQDKIKKAMIFIDGNKQEFSSYRLDFVVPDGVPSTPGISMDSWYEHARNFGVVATPTHGGPLKILAGHEPFTCRDKTCICQGSGIHTYGVGGDTCRNVDGDYDCLYISDLTLGMVIGEWHGRAKAMDLGIEWAKVCKWYGSASLPYTQNAWAAIEWNQLGVVVNEVMANLGIYLHISRSEDQTRKKRQPYLGIVIQPQNKVRLLHRYLVPQINEGCHDDPDFPRLFVPFKEFWSECQTYVYHASENLQAKPESAKPGAQTRKQKDDRVMAMLCLVYGATDRFGAIKGVNEYYERYMNQRRAAK